VDTVGSGQGPVAGSCKYGDEPSGYGTMDLVGYFYDHRSNCSAIITALCRTTEV
jgi:hypothetical protein